MRGEGEGGRGEGEREGGGRRRGRGGREGRERGGGEKLTAVLWWVVISCSYAMSHNFTLMSAEVVTTKVLSDEIVQDRTCLNKINKKHKNKIE
jgi:hypothetical protein